MSDVETWKQRVAEWRASGLKAEEFCAGRGYSKGALYEWSSKLRRARPAKPPEGVKLARVVRQRLGEGVDPSWGAAVSIELQGARVVVAPGADRATLAVVLEVLEARAGRGGR
jgi:transposase